MTVLVKTLIPSKIAEGTQTTQYTANGVTAIIDKFTATNYSASAATRAYGWCARRLIRCTQSAVSSSLKSTNDASP